MEHVLGNSPSALPSAVSPISPVVHRVIPADETTKPDPKSSVTISKPIEPGGIIHDAQSVLKNVTSPIERTAQTVEGLLSHSDIVKMAHDRCRQLHDKD